MKKPLKIIMFLALSLAVVACKWKMQEAHESQSDKNWKQMDAFHTIMAEAFHPYKDSMNLEPAKLAAKKMTAAAKEWSASDLPEKVNNDDMKEKLDQLTKESSLFSNIISSDDDSAIGEQLTKIHNLFHAIQEEWYEAHEH